MPLFKRCRFCHKNVASLLMSWHERKHLRRLPNGQQRDHVTEPPHRRYPGPLDGIPQQYHHAKCDHVTEMPEEIIRSYLVNPFLYDDHTFCCGCSAYVPMSELQWIESGQLVQDYMDQLRQEAAKCPIAFSEAAVDALREYAAGSSPRVRVAVSKLEHSTDDDTYQYHLELDDRQARKEDRVFEVESVEVLIDVASLPLVSGTEIDFQTGPDGTGFRFDNPNEL